MNFQNVVSELGGMMESFTRFDSEINDATMAIKSSIRMGTIARSVSVMNDCVTVVGNYPKGYSKNVLNLVAERLSIDGLTVTVGNSSVIASKKFP